MYRAFSKSLRIFLFLCATPVALAALVVGCRLGNVITTRPFLWSVTRSEPKPSELAGTYVISPASADFAESLLWSSSSHASIELRADHSAIVADFPNSDGFGKSDFTSSYGKGTWSLEAPGIDGIKIDINGLLASGGGSNHGGASFRSSRLWRCALGSHLAIRVIFRCR